VNPTKLSSRREATGSASPPDKDASISVLRRCEQEVGCEQVRRSGVNRKRGHQGQPEVVEQARRDRQRITAR